MGDRARIAVILAAHGEAETTGIRENYRVNMHTLGHASLVMPIPLQLRRFISVSSSLRKRVRSFSNSQASPHNSITRNQAEALKNRLDSLHAGTGLEFDVRAAFSASEPYQENVIDTTRSFDGQVIVSMSPIESTLSCGLLCSHLASARNSRELGKVRVLSRFWDDGGLYPLYLDHLFGKGALDDSLKPKGRALVLMFHGTLVTDAKGREPDFRTGLHETMSFAGRLSRMIEEHPANRYDKVYTAFLNHDVGGTWTKPSFEEVCMEIRNAGYSGADLFGCGYFADGNETIHRADELMRAAGLVDVSNISCFNASPLFTAYLASKVGVAVRQIIGLGAG